MMEISGFSVGHNKTKGDLDDGDKPSGSGHTETKG